ncbi:MAG TPA: HAD family phosphatase, partial [Polyangiaceae bacterium]|nr:HAD family phosphatase [Polyangiaceae bacterium]
MALFTLPTRTYSAYIFDCDGTLADSMPLHQKAWISALRKYGATFDFSWELFMSRAGKTIELTVSELNAEFGLSLDPTLVAAAQRAEFDALAVGVQPLEEVVAFARERARQGCPISVASGGDAPTVRRTL